MPFKKILQIPTAADSLPDDEKAIEAIACQNDFVYFLANYVYILDPERGKIKFELWPLHADLADFIVNNNRIIILKARQLGVSWLLASYALWRAEFKIGANVLMLSKREDEARSLLAKSVFIYNNLPVFMRKKVFKQNETEFSFIDNSIPNVASSSIKAFPSTEDAGRSEAASDVICDEWAYHPYAEVNYGAYKPTIDAGGKLIGVSTANGMGDNFFYKTWAEAKKPHRDWLPNKPIGLNGFVPLFLPWHLRPGRDQGWYLRQTDEYSSTPHLLAQEYPASDIDAFVQSGVCYFNKERIWMWMQMCRTAIQSEYGGIVKYWKFPMPGEQYAMGIDCAEGKGLDASGAAIYHLRTMEHVADIHGDITPDELASMCVTLAVQYNNAFICPERNSVGVGVIIDIVKNHGYTNVYKYRPVQNKLKLGRAQIVEFQRNEEYGWPTNQITRPLVIRDLAAAIQSGEIISPDLAFWNECLTFVNLRGKLQASEGNKDDRVFKHALALQAMKAYADQDLKETAKSTSQVLLRGSV